MTPIEKFIKDKYTPKIDEDKEGMTMGLYTFISLKRKRTTPNSMW
jgi:hypothetical protein